MNAQNLPDAVKNQSLFSNYYLDSLIVQQPQWAGTPDIESDYAAIKQRFDAVAPNAEHLNEAQTEHEFIQPLLGQLGHVFEVQPITPHVAGNQKTPITPSSHRPRSHNTAQSYINRRRILSIPLSPSGDAKAWSRNLDSNDARRRRPV